MGNLLRTVTEIRSRLMHLRHVVYVDAMQAKCYTVYCAYSLSIELEGR